MAWAFAVQQTSVSPELLWLEESHLNLRKLKQGVCQSIYGEWTSYDPSLVLLNFMRNFFVTKFLNFLRQKQKQLFKKFA